MGHEEVNQLPEKITGEQVFAALDCLGINPNLVYRVQIQPGKIMVARRHPVDTTDEHGIPRRSVEYTKVEFDFEPPANRPTS